MTTMYTDGDKKYLDILLRLRKARKQAGLTQKQAARKLNLNSHASIVAVENSERELKVRELIEMTDIYDVSIVWLLTGQNPNFDYDQFDQLVEQTQCTSQQQIDELNDLRDLLSSLKRNKD